MSTYNFTNGSQSGQIIPPETTLCENSMMVRRNIIDFSVTSLDAGDGDVGKCIVIPANTTVHAAGVRVITSNGNTASGSTIDIGYGGDVDEWGAAEILDTADAVVGGDWSPVFFASEDTVDIKATTDTADVDLDTGKIEVYAIMTKHLDNY